VRLILNFVSRRIDSSNVKEALKNSIETMDDSMMECEICGKGIHGEPHKIIIDGVKLIACGECAKTSSSRWGLESKPALRKRPLLKRPLLRSGRVKREGFEELELVEDYGSLIRRTREKLGFSCEELGRKIGERVSVLRKVEMNKMVPDQRLAKKLEHFLRIKLLVKPPTEIAEGKPVQKPYELTLGDVVSIRKKKEDVRG